MLGIKILYQQLQHFDHVHHDGDYDDDDDDDDDNSPFIHTSVRIK
jgi:hypothetical protein